MSSSCSLEAPTRGPKCCWGPECELSLPSGRSASSYCHLGGQVRWIWLFWLTFCWDILRTEFSFSHNSECPTFQKHFPGNNKSAATFDPFSSSDSALFQESSWDYHRLKESLNRMKIKYWHAPVDIRNYNAGKCRQGEIIQIKQNCNLHMYALRCDIMGRKEKKKSWTAIENLSNIKYLCSSIDIRNWKG